MVDERTISGIGRLSCRQIKRFSKIGLINRLYEGGISLIESNGLFQVEDVFFINRGKQKEQIAVLGQVKEGAFQVGDEVIIQKQSGLEIKTTVVRLLAFDPIEIAFKGYNVGMALSDVAITDISQGDIIVKRLDDNKKS